MKKLFYLLCIAVACISESCSNESEGLYSCNQAIDAWVRSNIQEIHLMTRADWLQADHNLQLPIYRAFTKEQKIEFWLEKILDVKRLDWTTDELKHISEVEYFIETHHDFFEEKGLSENQENELEIFFYQWLKSGIEEFNWDERVAYAIVSSGYCLKNTKGELETSHTFQSSVENLTDRSENSTTPACNCRVGHIFACFEGNDECKTIDCDETDIGCGWLLLQDCNGKCGL